DVIQNHLALELSALVGVEAHIVGIFIEIQSFHVQLAGGGVGGLTVKPDNGLILVGDGGAAAAGATLLFRCGVATASSQAERHGGGQRQSKRFLHNYSPFLIQ